MIVKIIFTELLLKVVSFIFIQDTSDFISHIKMGYFYYNIYLITSYTIIYLKLKLYT